MDVIVPQLQAQKNAFFAESQSFFETYSYEILVGVLVTIIGGCILSLLPTIQRWVKKRRRETKKRKMELLIQEQKDSIPKLENLREAIETGSWLQNLRLPNNTEFCEYLKEEWVKNTKLNKDYKTSLLSVMRLQAVAEYLKTSDLEMIHNSPKRSDEFKKDQTEGADLHFYKYMKVVYPTTLTKEITLYLEENAKN